MDQNLSFRLAKPEDIPTILHFVRTLAEYEKMASAVVADEALFHKWMFEQKVAESMLVFAGKKPIGFALYFHNFSTWIGRAGIYIEDVFVLPEYRGRGIGRTIFRKIAQKAVAEGCGRVEWWCLKWNEPSLKFYESIGAVQMEEWMPLRLAEDALKRLAEEK